MTCFNIKTNDSNLKTFRTEEELYKSLDMEWIPPELREGTGEIETALRKTQSKLVKLPKLIELEDIKGDLQVHSSFDIETSHDLGASTMSEIINAAGELGYEYLAFTEHNPSKSKHSEKQITDLLMKKRSRVNQLNKDLRFKNIAQRRQGYAGLGRVFNSLEIDILPDGSLPVPDAGLATLDFALVSIHSSFRQTRAEMTKRVLTALAHPKAKIFAHPTARKINHREGIELNWPEVFEFCKKHDKWLEINADPMRLDLPDYLVREALKQGVKLTFGTDAHHKDHLINMQWGVNVARRGWVEASNVVNTRGLEEFIKLLSE